MLLAPLFAVPVHQRLYLLGNSLTDDIIYDGFKAVVTNGGDTVALGSQRVPGAPINRLWNRPNLGNSHGPYGLYPNAFANYTWDAITLQPFSTYSIELSYARYFVRALRGNATFGIPDNDTVDPLDPTKEVVTADVPTVPLPGQPTGKSPDAAVFIYAQWPGVTDQWKSSQWLSNDPTQRNSAAYFDAFVTELRAAEPSTDIYLIPVGHVFHELHQLIRAGRFTGVTRQTDLMLDGIHLNDRGSYVPALTFYSAIYGRDPRGAVAPPKYPVTAAQAAIIQEAVWKVVSNHPLSTIAKKLVVTTPSLPDVVANKEFSTQFSHALAEGAVTWSVTPGTTLPTGLSLLSSGLLRGTVTAPGAYDLSVRARDTSGAVADRSFILFVASDQPPVVSTAALPDAPYGAPYQFVPSHTGGLGEITWSVAKGDLPHGMNLSDDGRLSGTPVSVRGTFSLTVRAVDAAGAATEKTLPLTVAAPAAATIIAGPAHVAPTINGRLNEGMWSQLPQTISRGSGATDNTGAFAVRHDRDAIYIGVRVSDANVRPAEDAVHVFIDGLHDREGVFNADDRHIVIYPDGTFAELNGRGAGILAKTLLETGGYTIELRLPWTNLGLEGGPASRSVGFDIGFEDVDSAGGTAVRRVWRAADPSDPSPATFGNLVLAGGPVTRNLVIDGSFDGTLSRPTYPGRATTAMAGLGWRANNVGTRPFATIDKLGYGYPTRSIIASGQSPSTGVYQVIKDNRAMKSRAVLRFDIRWADPDIAVRLYGYNGTAAEVDAAMTAGTQQHPVAGGTPAATLISTDLGAVPVVGTWQEVVLPFSAGTGYDYYLLAFSSVAGAVPLDSRVDNIELGPVALQQQVRP